MQIAAIAAVRSQSAAVGGVCGAEPSGWIIIHGRGDALLLRLRGAGVEEGTEERGRRVVDHGALSARDAFVRGELNHSRGTRRGCERPPAMDSRVRGWMKQQPEAHIDMEEMPVIPIRHLVANWLRRHGKAVHAPLTQCVTPSYHTVLRTSMRRVRSVANPQQRGTTYIRSGWDVDDGWLDSTLVAVLSVAQNAEGDVRADVQPHRPRQDPHEPYNLPQGLPLEMDSSHSPRCPISAAARGPGLPQCGFVR